MNLKQTTRQRLLIALALVVLALYAMLSLRDAISAQTHLDQTFSDLAEVASRIEDIERLRQAPTVAALQLESPAEITNRIAAARQAAGLPASSLLKEEPLDPQRVQRSDFELRSTTIDLAPATLPQIINFCDALRDEETGSVIRDITLTEPQNGATGGGQEKWGAQLVLTQMIFSPKSR
jgi:hypothetical protein